MAPTDDLRLEFTTATMLSLAERETSTAIHMQPFTRDSNGRWKKRGPGLVADSVEDHLSKAAELAGADKLHVLLDPKAHVKEPAPSTSGGTN